MRNKTLWLASALTAALVVAGVAMAGPGDKGGPGGKAGCGDKSLVSFGKDGFAAAFGDKAGGKGGPAGKFGDKAPPSTGGPGGKGGGKALPGKGGPGAKGGGKGGPGPGGFPGGAARGGSGFNLDEMVERILSFDQNKDGKVVKDELPERMQDLIAKGDSNKDGALDRDEIKKLATELPRDGAFGGFGGRGGFGGGFGGRGGPFPSGPGLPGGPGFPGGRGDGPGRSSIEAAVDNLKLADKKKDTAEAVVKAYQENVRKLMDLARAELLLKMKDVLSEQEFKTFKDALDRQSGPAPAGAPRSGDLERRLDQLQRELEGLRREIRR